MCSDVARLYSTEFYFIVCLCFDTFTYITRTGKVDLSKHSTPSDNEYILLYKDMVK